MNRHISLPSIIGVLLLVLISSCEHDVIEPDNPNVGDNPNDTLSNPCDTSKVFFQNDILPIFRSNCAFSGCHDAGTAQNDVILTTYENVIESNVIKPNDPDGSELYRRITETDVDRRMPFFQDSLSPIQINVIRQWILDGAVNSFCQEKIRCDTTDVTFSKVIAPIVQQNCIGCHSGSSPGGGIDFSMFSELQEAAKDMRMLNAVLHAPGFKAMPLGGSKLPECDIEAIRKWTNDGAPNN